MEEWTTRWPAKQGVYLFYGYPVNYNMDGFPRLMLVTVEYNSTNFGTVYRTTRSTITQSTGAWGYWLPFFVPEMPTISEHDKELAKRKAGQLRRIKPLEMLD
jgi:hypothetical protein